jgi:carboxymethylenebutenolidase
MQKELIVNNRPVYHTYPDDGQKHPGLIVIEEIWGVNDHVKSVADRFAQAGFSVLSPELLPQGLLDMLTPQIQKDLFDPEKRNAIQPKLREAMAPIQQPQYAQDAIATLKACVDYLLEDKGVSGSVAVLGFCFGGSYSFHLAAHDARIKAGVPFYGHAPSDEEIANIGCPVLAFYGDQDANLIQSLPKLKDDMQKHGKQFEAVVYEGAGHAFFNDSNPHAYRADNARDAWDKTLAFLAKHLED